jgi:cysteine desulfuration protein SufE
MTSPTAPLPVGLQRVVDDFASVPSDLRVEVLVEYADKVPPLPSRYTDEHDRMEEVTECQTPFFLATEVADDGTVSLWFDCPPAAPTQRGFAGILREGLEGAAVDEVLAVPGDFHRDMGLAEAISPLRLRGLDAILARLKRQLRERTS